MKTHFKDLMTSAVGKKYKITYVEGNKGYNVRIIGPEGESHSAEGIPLERLDGLMWSSVIGSRTGIDIHIRGLIDLIKRLEKRAEVKARNRKLSHRVYIHINRFLNKLSNSDSNKREDRAYEFGVNPRSNFG